MSDVSGNLKVVSWKAVAVSVGASLEVYPEDEDNKEALWFVGKYSSSGTGNLSGDKSKERKAKGNLENGSAQSKPKFAGFANNGPATFNVTKTKNGDAYDVIISFSDGGGIGGVEYFYTARFKGKGDIREGKGKGTWYTGIPGISDDKKKKVSQKAAVAESEKNELTVSELVVVDGTSSVNHGQNTNKKILTFVGQYSDQKEVFADPEEEESWEKKRKASGHLEFQGTEFAAKDKAGFKATRNLKKGSKDTYEVTISFTLIVGGKEQSAISAEFKGEGDIREGEGEGTWEAK